MLELAIGVVIGLAVGFVIGLLVARLRAARLLGECRAELAALRESLAAEQRQAAEKLKLLDETKQQLADHFKALAADALKANGEMITQRHREGLDRTLKPLAEKLQQFGKQVQESYEKGARDRAGLAKEVKLLAELNVKMSEEAEGLTRALKGDARARGEWAEVTLKRILEHAGLREGQEYRYQESFTEGESRSRLDVIVDLPEGKSLVIDSKLSLISWTQLVEATEETAQSAARRDFLAAIRTHMKQLGAKNYQQLHGIETLDFVLMFVPIEAAFVEALSADQSLYQDALDLNIAPVSPSTLLATMRTVAAIWRYDKQEQNAIKIATEAGRMYDKLVGFVEVLDKIGQRLDQAQESWQQARNRLSDGRGNLVGRAEKLRTLGARTAKKLKLDYQGEDEEPSEEEEAE